MVSAICYWRGAVILGKAQASEAVAGLVKAAVSDKASSIKVYEEALNLAKTTFKAAEADISRLQEVCLERWPRADSFKPAA